MDSLKEVKQAEGQTLSEPLKCSWILSKGARIGEMCGKTAIGHKWCSIHKQCNPDVQKYKVSQNEPSLDSDDENDSVSHTTEKLQKLVLDESSIIEFVIKRKHVRITIE